MDVIALFALLSLAIFGGTWLIVYEDRDRD